MLYGMPEDAALMIQGQQGAPLAKTNSINLSTEQHSNHYMLEQPEEDFVRVKQSEPNRKEINAPSSRHYQTMVDPRLLEQYQ